MTKKLMIICTTVPSSFCFFRGQVQELKKSFQVRVLSSSGNLFQRFCHEEDVKGFAIDIKREISIFNDIISLLKIIMVFAKHRPSMIHANTPKASLLTLFAAWLTRVPHRIYYVHGLRYEGSLGMMKRMLMSFERLSCMFATEIIAVGYGVKSTLRRDLITRKMIQIIHYGTINGIDTDCFRNEAIENTIRDQYEIPQDAIVFGFIGRLVKDKGVNELVDCFQQISLYRKNVYLFLVGPYEPHLDALSQKTIQEIDANEKIISTGIVQDVRKYLKSFDVFVLPSYREGFNNAILEALSMNVPCICTNINGCNEAIVHNLNGLLVTPHSQESLYETLEIILENNTLLNKMKSNSRSSVIEKYNQKTVWKHARKAYEKIVYEKSM